MQILVIKVLMFIYLSASVHLLYFLLGSLTIVIVPCSAKQGESTEQGEPCEWWTSMVYLQGDYFQKWKFSITYIWSNWFQWGFGRSNVWCPNGYLEQNIQVCCNSTILNSVCTIIWNYFLMNDVNDEIVCESVPAEQTLWLLLFSFSSSSLTSRISLCLMLLLSLLFSRESKTSIFVSICFFVLYCIQVFI